MIDQIVIAVCGIGSVFLSQSAVEARRRYACIVGIAAQPAWMYATVVAEQWGMFALTFFYAFAWARGVWNFWIQPRFGKE